MAKLVISEFLTLDGVMEDPSWSGAYWNDEIAAFKAAEMQAAQALLQGRVTYEGMAAAWPSRAGDPGADLMNSLPKYVVSTTLQDASWNNSTIIRDHVVEEVRAVKERYGGDLLVYGSGGLAQTLLDAGLVDGLNLLVYPLTLGSGKRFFRDGLGSVKLALREARPVGSGVVLLQYGPADV
jgi:dihydrofolate reductase